MIGGIGRVGQGVVSDKVQSAGRRLSIVTVDQVVAGASNVLVAVLAARMLGVGAFGLFGIVFIIYVTAQGVSRALICDPLLVHPDEVQERPGDAIGSARVLGLAVGAAVCVVAAVSWVWSDTLGSALLVLGVCMPALVLQDLARYLGIVRHRPSEALLFDLLWLVLMVATIGVLVATGRTSLVWFVAAWAGSGAVAGAVAPWRFRHHPMRHSWSWTRETWGYSWRYLLTFGATQGSALASSVGVAAVSGVQVLGAIRGALLLVRPSATLQAASVAAGVAEVSRMPPGSDEVGRHVRRTTVLTTSVALVNLAVLLLLPDAAGRAVLGDTWEPTKELLLPAGLQMVLLAVVSGPRAALLGQRAVRVTVRIDVVSTFLLLVATVAGAVVNDALGAYWALVVCQSVISVVWWVVVARYDDSRLGRGDDGAVLQDGPAEPAPVDEVRE